MEPKRDYHYLHALKETDPDRLREVTSSGGKARAEKYPAGYFTAKMRAAKAAKRRQRLIDEAVAKALAEAQTDGAA